jgi:hypothetical protein
MAQIIIVLSLLVLSSLTAFSQDKIADFSGAWNLDVAASKLDERSRIESITMTVTQTATDLKIETATKRAAAQGDMGGRGGGMGRGGGFGGGDGTTAYTLDGKEKTVQQESPVGNVPVKLKAKTEKDGKLKLTSSRTLDTPMGSVTLTTTETWSLSDDGKTLTLKRDMDSPRGTTSSTMVFRKND